MIRRRWLCAVAIAVSALACSGDGGGTPASLVGTWSVGKYEYVSTSNASIRVDLIARGGVGTLVLKSDGSWQFTLTMPGTPSETVAGSWSASSDVLTTTQVDRSGQMQFDYRVSGATLTLTGADSDWDFDGDGAGEPAKVNVTATRG